MTTIFDNYEKQFGSTAADITLKLSEIARENSIVQKKILVSQANNLFDESNGILEQMELEIEEMPYDARSKFSNRVLAYRRELQNLEKEFKSYKFSNKSNTILRLDSDDTVHYDNTIDTDMKTQLLSNTSRLERSSNRLNEGLQSASQSEEIGAGILSSLSQQRETLQRSRDRLRNANEDLISSGRILTEMTKRVFQNRMVSFLVIFILVLAFIGILYSILHKNSEDNIENLTPASKPKNK